MQKNAEFFDPKSFQFETVKPTRELLAQLFISQDDTELKIPPLYFSIEKEATEVKSSIVQSIIIILIFAFILVQPACKQPETRLTIPEKPIRLKKKNTSFSSQLPFNQLKPLGKIPSEIKFKIIAEKNQWQQGKPAYIDIILENSSTKSIDLEEIDPVLYLDNGKGIPYSGSIDLANGGTPLERSMRVNLYLDPSERLQVKVDVTKLYWVGRLGGDWHSQNVYDLATPGTYVLFLEVSRLTGEVEFGTPYKKAIKDRAFSNKVEITIVPSDKKQIEVVESTEIKH